MLNQKFVRNKDIKWRKEVDSILFMKENELYTLNNVGAFIWELCNGDYTVNEIINIINQEYKIDKNIIKSDVIEFLMNLLNEKIIEEKI
ncbi:hypothetical protein OSSY52_02190 [Tepiditoga spiralis]|uniref:PqqD family protein n=1 Tax=Tepiditoga spiralis TaxID=2108365 RepID=A0A7G1G1Q6_9BACT|nr:PqqD family protein [Tepiditoga spiralis]BBE30078.1 hypothetical protein OSSY52_02190 [Tepiditoga spiralis]